MKWQVVAGAKLDADEQLNRIYAAKRILDAVAKGNQQITPRVLESLRVLAEDGVRYMLYWYHLEQSGEFEGDDEVTPDSVEEGLDRAIAELLNTH